MILAVQEQLLGSSVPWVLTALALALVFFVLIVAISRRYKRCPSNRILVIYGRTTAGQVSKTRHGGGAFVIPLLQDYEYLSLDPMQIEIPLEAALSMENIRVSVPSVFTVAIGTDEERMHNAAIRLLGLKTPDIMKQAEDILFGQLRQVIASMRIEEINRDRDVFLSSIQSSLEPELKKIGLVLINVNIKDITDESGYIEAIGRKAAATAIKQAEVDVAEQDKKGAIGVADAQRDQAIQVANAEKTRDIGTKEAERERAVRLAVLDKEKIVGEQAAQFAQEAEVRETEREMRVRVAEANAKAVAGENEAKALIAKTNADLRVREAEAFQRAETRHREAQAAVLEAQYLAEARAAAAQAKKIEAETRARLEAVSLAEKAKTIVDAEASAAQKKISAEAEAAANFVRLEAEARGQFEILAKKGEGLKRIVESCGGAQEAFQMLMLEHLEHLSETAAKAISNVKFDKVIVWDGGAKDGGTSATAGFLRGLASSLPPVMQIMKDIGGVQMPEYFAKLVEESKAKQPEAVREDAEPSDQPMRQRPRRNRKSAALRELAAESGSSARRFLQPLFVHEKPKDEAIAAMPGCARLSPEGLLGAAEGTLEDGVPGVVLFPAIDPRRKSAGAEEAYDERGLVPRSVAELKRRWPELLVVTDVALDPYSTHGHDGLVGEDGRVLNDETVEVLCRQALAHARAGADVVAPSDMMDGRVGAIRDALDAHGFSEVSILSYTAKYASAFYGPFREALDSAPRSGDKKAYQMDPRNAREALREARLDEAEGADLLMVKPAGPYLDVIRALREATTLPVAAYQVSGEYAMLKAAAERGWLDEERAVLESLAAIRRAGADVILTYYARQAARWLR